MAAETVKAQQARAYNAIQVLGSATPTELADYLNGAREVYPKLTEVSTDRAKKLLDGLHKDELVVSAGGTRYKPAE